MAAIVIPRYRYSVSDYPDMDPSAEGLVIPERYGTLTSLVPVCIDLTTGKWKLNRRTIHAITEIREAGTALDPASEYTADLANGEFTVGVTPTVEADTTYYFVLESDYTIDGSNYLQFAQQTLGGIYTNGTCYFIDGADAWSDQSTDIQFKIYAKTALDAAEKVIVNNEVWGAGWNYHAYLRKTAANTRIAQSFKTPATGGPWYISRIHVTAQEVGSVDAERITRASILSAYNPAEVQVGAKSYRLEEYTGTANNAYFAQRGAATDLSVDIEGIEDGDGNLMTNVADFLQDIHVNILGGDAGALDAADLAALKTARPEVLALNLDSETDNDTVIRTLEAGQLFKYIPQLDGTIGLKYAESGEPAGTPHFRDPHFVSFTMRRVWGDIYERVNVKYGTAGGSGETLTATAEDLSAKYLYRNLRTLEVDTRLTAAADALQLAEDCLGTDGGSSRRQYLSQPCVEVEFELVAGLGWDLIPAMKVKLSRTRAMTATGALAGVLFWIKDVDKDPGSGRVTVTAILDALTY
jgi:hypothetical protein